MSNIQTTMNGVCWTFTEMYVFPDCNEMFGRTLFVRCALLECALLESTLMSRTNFFRANVR